MKNVISYFVSILTAKENTPVETRLLRYAFVSLIFLIILAAGVQVFYISTFSNGQDYLPFLAMNVLTSVVLTFSYFHAVSFKKKLSCQNGMMVGMTLGMVSGFLVGAIIAATNGMFVGCVVGIIVGILIGALSAKSCGVMGVMEGVMAGVMSGLMGPMTVIMTLNDNLLLLLYFVFALCYALILGLSYMLYKEEGQTPVEKKSSLVSFVIISVALFVVIILIMLFGPKGPLTFV